MIDNYDIPIKELDSIKNKEILKEEYKHTLTRMLNFEKFLKEKIMLLLISSIVTVIAFGIGKTIEKANPTIYLDFMLYGLIGLTVGFGCLCFVTHNVNNDLKTRKEKPIKLLGGRSSITNRRRGNKCPRRF